MLTKEQRQEIVDKCIYYNSLIIAEAKRLEAEDKPKRKTKFQTSVNSALAKRRAQRYKKT